MQEKILCSYLRKDNDLLKNMMIIQSSYVMNNFSIQYNITQNGDIRISYQDC